jgi:hypothetical protein
LVVEPEKGLPRDSNRQTTLVLLQSLVKEDLVLSTVGSPLTASPSASVKGNGAASVIQCGWGSLAAELEGVGLRIRCNAYATLKLPLSTTSEVLNFCLPSG